MLENKTEKPANDNDVIHATKCNNNFPKNLLWQITLWIILWEKISQGKNYVYARIIQV